MMGKLKVNKAFAESYAKQKEREELQKLRDKYGDDYANEETSSTSESEDSDAEALTPEIEKDWLRTLSAIKSGDRRILDPTTTFYHDSRGDSSAESSADKDEKPSGSDQKKKKKKVDKPMYLKDFERKVMTEREGVFSSAEESSDDEGRAKPPSYYELQEATRKNLKSLVDEDEDSDDDDLLIERKASAHEKLKKEEEYVEWLKGRKGELTGDKQMGAELESLRNIWTDPNIPVDEKFLRDYILDKGFLDEDQKESEMYKQMADAEDLSAESDQLEKEELFEDKYNHRHEQPDPDFIKSYPRTIASSMRNKDSRRAERRKLVKERKHKELEKKKEELKRLKNLEAREFRSKLSQVMLTSGNRALSEAQLRTTLDRDFDPADHDELMQMIIDAGYYDQEADNEKPVFSDLEDDETEFGDIDYDNWTGRKNEGNDCEREVGGEELEQDETELQCDHPDFNMDADHVPKEKQQAKDKKKKSTFAKALDKKKPIYDPLKETFEAYLATHYKFDYEDIIDDLPVRFHYRKVTPNDYGLTTDEIMRANDKELNSWASLKKICKIKTKEEEEEEVKKYRQRVNKKFKILTSLNPKAEAESPESLEKAKRKKKKKEKKADGSVAAESVTETVSELNSLEKKCRITNTLSVDDGEKRLKRQFGEMSDKPSKDVYAKRLKAETVSKPSKIKQAAACHETEKSRQTEPGSDKKKKKKKCLAETVKTSSIDGTSLQRTEPGSEKRKKKKNHRAEEVQTPSMDSNAQNENKATAISISPEKINVNKSNEVIEDSDKMASCKKSKIKKRKDKLTISDDRLKAYGINPKKFKYVYLKNLKEKNK